MSTQAINALPHKVGSSMELKLEMPLGEEILVFDVKEAAAWNRCVDEVMRLNAARPTTPMFAEQLCTWLGIHFRSSDAPEPGFICDLLRGITKPLDWLPPAQAPSESVVRGEDGIGPEVTIKRRCFDCKVCTTESYRVQSDSGTDVYCSHPEFADEPKARKYVGDSNWDTPDWCPALKANPASPEAGERVDGDERQRFEKWYATHAFDYARDPIGSRDCDLQWRAWQAALAGRHGTNPFPQVDLRGMGHGCLAIMQAEISTPSEPAQAAKVPDGWVLVPRELTAEMRVAGSDRLQARLWESYVAEVVDIYEAMLTASPTPAKGE